MSTCGWIPVHWIVKLIISHSSVNYITIKFETFHSNVIFQDMTSSRGTLWAQERSQPPHPPCHCVRVAFTCWCLYRSPARFFSCWRGLVSLFMDEDCKASRPWGKAPSTTTSLMSRLSNALRVRRRRRDESWTFLKTRNSANRLTRNEGWGCQIQRRLSLMYGRASCWILHYFA